MDRRGMNGEQFGLFDDVAEILDRRTRLAEWRRSLEVPCCPLPEEEIQAWAEGRGLVFRPDTTYVRCGRCGSPETEYGIMSMTGGHDAGWTGCGWGLDPVLTGTDVMGNPIGPGVPLVTVLRGYGYRDGFWTPMAPEQMDWRHDRLHHPDCGRCGHAKMIHGQYGLLPEEGSCLRWCGCKGWQETKPKESGNAD